LARASSVYVCQACGATHPKWAGRCDACGDWNTLIEEVTQPVAGRASRTRGRQVALTPLDGAVSPVPRRPTGIAEFDRVTGGGLVPGSALLVGGEPGIGKSTLLLQVAAAVSAEARCAYVSGEEAVDQIKLRADRLGLRASGVGLAAATAVRDIAALLAAPDGPEIMVVDSVQTLHLDALDSAPGTVAQVRASAHELIQVAKRRGAVLLLVGHVTKEGLLAGPKVLEHMVDAVLAFEGERGHQFRILRAAKNRFGATDEIGVFEMTDGGLMEVPNPSALFLAEREAGVAGSAVFAGIEGTRPVLVEVQSLIVPSPLATPRRAVVGWDGGRLAMVLAVLEARCGLALNSAEVFLNIAGGLRITEPAADLAVAAALASAESGVPLPPETVVFGEIGLGGEIRAVARTDARLKEAAKLGFGRAIVPARRGTTAAGMELLEVSHVSDLLRHIRPLGAEPLRRMARPESRHA